MLPGKIVYSPHYLVRLENHVYQTEKYSLVKDRLIREGWAKEEDFIEPELPSEETLLLVHSREYLNDLKGLRFTQRTCRAELPLTRDLVDSALYSVSGTILALEEALKARIGIHLGGGHHHAFPDHAEGFCYLNDVAICARQAIAKGVAEKVAIVDCDLHQGNGTAFIFQNEPRVFTFSIHEEEIYPKKEKSSLDIGLNGGTGDIEYLRELERGLTEVLRFQPELIIYVGGVDPFRYDKLGSLKLTKEGLLKRDSMVLGECAQRRIPCVVTMAGGYAFKVEDTVDLHFQTVITAIRFMKILNG
ncbi:MAG: histone deacetylase [Caldiserica bacterium]|jgi:acetoin utilization deacetylase AcuC-like enzyme|nr:histone deacetylase [Caldisericota bacterium]MDH7561776.1 histone deacetylase [Caldisericota bacterium]